MKTPDELLEMAARAYRGLSPTQIEQMEQIALNRRDLLKARNQ